MSRRLEILKNAREVVARPKGWVKTWVEPTSETEDGYAYCALGAVKTAAGLLPYGTHWNAETVEAALALADVVPDRYVGSERRSAAMNYNDRTSQKCVVELFDETIRREEAKETK